MKKISVLFATVFATSLFFVACDKSEDGPVDPNGGDALAGIEYEDIKVVTEEASFDTTWAQSGGMSATVNWTDTWDDEMALVKLSVAEQKRLMNTYADGKTLYLAAVQAWPAATAQFCAVILDASKKELARGPFSNIKVTGNAWARTILKYQFGYEITGEKDLYVGYLAKGAAVNTYPCTLMDKIYEFPGKTAQYPSFGWLPKVDTEYEEINDDPILKRWDWAENANWCIKMVFGVEKTYEN